ncbi:phage tail protein [Aeromonas allosaccharophila]|uniref:phage tail protein n=1 Tax=Aeromonas allosaccharophila TaxID=656 RepID=UPI00342EEDCB
MAIYFAIPTNAGQAKISNALALGIPLKITHMAVGDGNGQPVTPDPAQTKLVREQRRAPLNTLFQDPLNPAQLVAEQIIPENVGGWWIREVGLYDETGTMIAIANSPDTYKPQLSEGSGRTQTIRMVLIVSDTSAVELKIDPSVVLATRKYVDDVMKAHKESRDHPDASEVSKGFTQYANLQKALAGEADNLAVTPKVMKAVMADLGPKYGAPMIGVPIDWPLAQLPQDIWSDCGMIFLSCAGQVFNKLSYPLAAQLYPSGVMPEHRATFVRGWDGGLGKDPGRVLLSHQEGSIQSHTHGLPIQIGNVNTSGYDMGARWVGTVTESSPTGGTENRPESIAYHKIMRVS